MTSTTGTIVLLAIFGLAALLIALPRVLARRGGDATRDTDA
jgi:hypothetical protein